jgi:enediyne biosynthesis protein E3
MPRSGSTTRFAGLLGEFDQARFPGAMLSACALRPASHVLDINATRNLAGTDKAFSDHVDANGAAVNCGTFQYGFEQGDTDEEPTMSLAKTRTSGVRTVMLSKILKPFIKLSVDDFRRLAEQQFGSHPESRRAWPHFEPTAHAVVDNFWGTVDNPRFEAVVAMLEANPAKVRGIAYEGVGMGLTLLDFLLPYKKRVRRFLDGPCGPYRPLFYIGVGIALPRLPVDPLRVVARYDDADRWFIIDGYGFYRGFFDSHASLDQHSRPDWLTGEAARCFDNGLGRSLWFLSSANPQRIAATIQGFPPVRRGDLWGGIGLACGYAGGVLDRDGVGQLLDASGSDAGDFAVGVAVAAVFRQQTNLPEDHTDVACDVVWGANSGEVARLAAAECAGTYPDLAGPRYDPWRERMRTMWKRRCHLAESAEEADR